MSGKLKTRLLFFRLQLKSVIHTLPRLLLCLIILSAILAFTGYVGIKVSEKDKTASQANVDVVMDPTDLQVQLAFKLYISTKGMASVAACNPCFELNASLNRLKQGNVSAVVDIPFGFAAGILNGENYPANVYLSTSPGVESLLFTYVISAGINALANVEAASYALLDVAFNNGLDKSVYDAISDDMNAVSIQMFLAKDKFFLNKPISTTGSLRSLHFYFATLMVLLIFFCGIGVTGVFSEKNLTIMNTMKSLGLSRTYIRICEYLSVSVLFILLFTLLSVPAAVFVFDKALRITFLGILCFILVIISITAFITFVNMISDRGIMTTIIIFIAGVSMAYAGGRIIPSVYLPESLRNIGNLLPVKHWCVLVENAFTGNITIPSLAYTLISFVLFISLALFITNIRKEKTYL